MTVKLTNHPQGSLSYKFVYDGSTRIVDNAKIGPKGDLIVGFEVRKSGKFSYKIKSYKIANITDLILIDPVNRSGPKIGRP